MKKLVLIFSIISTLLSCQITEKIYLKEDGSGTYNMKIDMSAMLESLSELGSDEVDSTYVAKDSIINFSDMLIKNKDSIDKLPKEKRKQLEKFKTMSMVIHEDKKNNESWVSIKGGFNNVDDLDDLQNILNSFQSSDKQMLSKYDIKYTFTKNKFIRTSSKKDLNKEELEKFNKSIKNFEMFLGGTNYNLEYHFPKPIKKTNLKDARLSEDRKTIYINKPINDWLNNASAFDFEVKLKK